MSEKSSGEVRFQLDPENLPSLSKQEVDRLRAMTDEEIDLSDGPAQTVPPTRRVLGPRFGAPATMLVLEPDVLEFFNENGGVSAGKINAALREYAETHRKTA